MIEQKVKIIDAISDLFICPITHLRLHPLNISKTDEIKGFFQLNNLVNTNSININDNIDYALGTEDGNYVYPVIDDIFFLVPTMAMAVGNIDSNINSITEVNSSTIAETKIFYDEYGWQKDFGNNVYNDAVIFEDLRPVSKDYIHKCHLRLNRYINNSGKFLLDIASGPVQYDEYLTYSRGFDYRICADISLKALKEAKKKIKDKGIYVLCDITNIPIRNDSVDSVISLHTLYHVPLEKQKNALREFHRVLKPNCKVMIVYSWGSKSILMKVNFLHDVYCALKIIVSKRFDMFKINISSTESVKTQKMLYYGVHDLKWFIENGRTQFKLELVSWRSVSVKFLQFFIHEFLFGRLILNFIYNLEDSFPRIFGKYGQYPIIILKKYIV